ncbi:AhpC/TSA family protein [bacterium]|nr:AhpC/TSA family protein [bacterium]
MRITGITFILLLILSACTSNPDSENKDVNVEVKDTVVMDTYTYLQEELDKKKADFEENASEEKKRIYSEGILAVQNSGIIQSAANVGDTAIDFTLTNANGKEVNLYELLKNGPVVLTWYRGGWCPYCNITLRRLQEELPNFKEQGAQLVALTPELPDRSLSTKEKLDLEFHVLSDVANVVARKYGIVFDLTPEVAVAYQESFGLHEYNGDETNELPLAATYVIDENHVIRYAFVDAEYRNRAEPKAILEALKMINN